MATRWWTALAVGLILLGSGGEVRAQAEQGAAAPLFSLADLEGKQVALKSLRGKVAVLGFWATWHAPSRKAMSYLQRLTQDPRVAAGDVAVYSLDLNQDKATVQACLATNHFTFPVLLDHGEVAKRYGVTELPLTVVVDRNGRVAYRTDNFGLLTEMALDEAIKTAVAAKADEAEQAKVDAELAQAAAGPRVVRDFAAIDTKGKVVLLDFWATWCPPCRVSMPKTQEWSVSPAAKQGKLAVVAVNLAETEAQVKQFLAANQYTFTTLLDSEGAFGEQYRVESIPTFVVLNREGKEAFRTVGAGPATEARLKQAIERLLTP